MSLSYADADSAPFSNIGPESASSDMWPLCLRGLTAIIQFRSVSTLARSRGVDAGTMVRIQFSPHSHEYVMSYLTTGGGVVTVYGEYTWSLAQRWSDSVSGGQNTRQAVLDLTRAGWGEMVWLANNRRVGTLSCTMGTADVWLDQ